LSIRVCGYIFGLHLYSASVTGSREIWGVKGVQKIKKDLVEELAQLKAKLVEEVIKDKNQDLV